MESKLKEKDLFQSPKKIEEGDGEICSSNEVEKTKLVQLRAMLEKQDPSCKEIDDPTLRRFLRARDLDVEKASGMFIKYLTWRRSFVPKGSITLSEITNQIADNKIFMQGKDKKGCPVSVILGARHFPSKKGTDELKRLMVFFLEKLCSRIPDGQGTFMIISDLQGYGYSNIDVRGTIAAISILLDYYPGRLEKVLIIHAPYIFMTVWKAIYPFIDKNNRKKFVLVEKERVKATLLEEIEESQLPEIYGGKLKLVPIDQDA